MPSDDSGAWTLQHHELMSPVTAILGCTQLLQRQILRASGLTNLERDLLLGNLAAIALSTRGLGDQVQARLALIEPADPETPG